MIERAIWKGERWREGGERERGRERGRERERETDWVKGCVEIV